MLDRLEAADRTAELVADLRVLDGHVKAGCGAADLLGREHHQGDVERGLHCPGTAATGGQDILSSQAANPIRATKMSIADAVRGVGVKWVRTITRTYDVAAMRDTLREALTTKEKGPKVIVAQSECELNKQRRVKPLMAKMAKEGKRVVRERFGVDADTCTGDHSCIRLSGCPSLTVAENPDPLRKDPVATVLDSCSGCGLCGEVSHAAVLCPSFFRAEVISNPNAWDGLKVRVRNAVIGFLQRRIDRRLAGITA